MIVRNKILSVLHGWGDSPVSSAENCIIIGEIPGVIYVLSCHQTSCPAVIKVPVFVLRDLAVLISSLSTVQLVFLSGEQSTDQTRAQSESE